MTDSGVPPPFKKPDEPEETPGAGGSKPWRRGGGPRATPPPGGVPTPWAPKPATPSPDPPPPDPPATDPPSPRPDDTRPLAEEPAEGEEEEGLGIDQTLVQPAPGAGEDAPQGKEEEGLEIDRTMVQPAEPAGEEKPEPFDRTMVDRSAAAEPHPDHPEIPGVTILREIGRGGMGVVYEGTQGYLDRRVAVKLLAQGGQSEDFTRRFQREAKILAALTHPHVVSCYQAGVAPDSRCFLVMEFIDGPTLGDWIEEHGPLQTGEALRVCNSVASALAYAHRSGIIHRDVKPANVLLKTAPERGGDPFPFEPMLADLGLARVSRDLPSSPDLDLTVQGTVMGSPPTMAPEQFDAPDDVDYRTDIYGLGCVLFHCLTGKLAFPQSSLTKLIARKTHGDPPDPSDLRSDLPPGLVDLVRSMIARDPGDRPASYDELLTRFEGPFGEAPRRRRRAPVLAAAAGVLLLGGWGLASLLGGESEPDAPQETARLDAEAPAPIEPVPADPPDEPPILPDGSGGADGELDAGVLDSFAGDAEAGPEVPEPEVPEPGDLDGEPGPGNEEGGADLEEEDPGASSPGTEAGTGDGEGESIDEEEAEPEPEPELPDLPPISPGETWPLFGGGDSLLDGWESTAGEREAWSRLEDTWNGAQVFTFEGPSTLERELPSPAWALSGRLEMLRPTRALTRRLSVVVHMSGGSTVELRQGIVDEEVALTASIVRSGDGGPDAELEHAELSIGTMSREDYQENAPVAFRVEWDGSRLALSWGLEGAGEEGRRGAEIAAGDVAVLGVPARLGIEVDSGAAILRDLVVEGR